jgi:hypothetical protein
MSIWMGTRTRNFDAVGHLLLRFGSMFFGIGFGLEVAHFFPSLPFVLLVAFAFIVGVGLIAFANYRAKATENAAKLQTK